MSGIDALLASLPAWALVVGKGGTGKTTCASALAIRSARSGTETLLLSTDPAGTLPDVLGTPLGGEPRRVGELAHLFASQLDAASARAEFLRHQRDVLATIIDRGTYLDREDIDGLVDAALPGIDETMGLLALADLAAEARWQRVFIDTAPTGHTLRLLALPDTFRTVVDLLDTMQAKHRFMVSALTRRYRADDADAFIAELRGRIQRLETMLTDRTRTAVVLVTRPEDVVLAETERYAEALGQMGISVAAVLLNAVPETGDPTRRTASDDVRRVLRAAHTSNAYAVPLLDRVRSGMPGIDAWTSTVRHADGDTREAEGGRRKGRRPRARMRSGTSNRSAAAVVRALPSVVICGGKGGVGKTTVSCALALAAARMGEATTLVSTDPAPSIADALGQPVGDVEEPVRDGFGLVARQVDASAAFARWRAEYQSRVEAAFDALLGGGMDAAHDRAVARDLFALAPPGIDELYALVWLGDALAEDRFQRLIVDPAPTGHLIRLLEMPALALDWSHRLLRLMLKYRELAGGGEMSSELLMFARRTRAVGALLRDPARAGVIVVALDEPVVRLESSRLVARVRTIGCDVPAVIWNRVAELPTPLPAEPPVRQFVAPTVSPPPVGTARLLRWLDEWRPLEVDG